MGKEHKFEELKNPEFLNSLNFLDAFMIKDIINKNIDLNFNIISNVKYLIKKFPIIFNRDYIAELFIRTKRRIHYNLDSDYYNEDFFLKILNKEKKLLKKNKEIHNKYKLYLLEFHSILPDNFYIRKEKNKKYILKFFPEYFYLLENPYDIKIFEKVLNNNIILNEGMLKRLIFLKNYKEIQLFILKNLFEKQNIYNNFNLFEKLIKENENNFNFLNDVIDNLNLIYFPVYLSEENIKKNKKDFYKIAEKCPNLYFQDECIYTDLKVFDTILNKIFSKYTLYLEDNNEIIWNISENEISKICEKITYNIAKYDISLDNININNSNSMKKLIIMDLNFYIFFYFKGKYSEDFIKFIKNMPMSRDSEKYFYKENYSEIFKTSLNNDFYEDSLKKNNFDYILTTELHYYFLDVISEYLSLNKINKDMKLKIIINTPKLIIYPEIYNKFNKEEIEKLIIKNDLIFRYLSIDITENYENLSKIAIRKNENNIKYIHIKYLDNKKFIKELLSENKKILKKLLKILNTYKDYNFDFLENIIFNEYKRTLDSEYLYYLNDEIIENLILSKTINLKDIKDKKSKNKIRKIYSNLSSEDFF